MKLQFNVDKSVLVKKVDRIFDNDSWPEEILQNALRANATEISIKSVRGNGGVWNYTSFEMRDNGIGLDTAAWESLLTFGTSGWDGKVQEEQAVGGMGLFSVMTVYPMTLRSNGKLLKTTPDEITSMGFVEVTDDPDPIQGTHIIIDCRNRDGNWGVSNLVEGDAKFDWYFRNAAGQDVDIWVNGTKRDLKAKLAQRIRDASPINCVHEGRLGVPSDLGGYAAFDFSVGQSKLRLHLLGRTGSLSLEGSYVLLGKKVTFTGSEMFQAYVKDMCTSHGYTQSGGYVIEQLSGPPALRLSLPDRKTYAQDDNYKALCAALDALLLEKELVILPKTRLVRDCNGTLMAYDPDKHLCVRRANRSAAYICQLEDYAAATDQLGGREFVYRPKVDKALLLPAQALLPVYDLNQTDAQDDILREDVEVVVHNIDDCANSADIYMRKLKEGDLLFTLEHAEEPTIEVKYKGGNIVISGDHEQGGFNDSEDGNSDDICYDQNDLYLRYGGEIQWDHVKYALEVVLCDNTGRNIEDEKAEEMADAVMVAIEDKREHLTEIIIKPNGDSKFSELILDEVRPALRAGLRNRARYATIARGDLQLSPYDKRDGTHLSVDFVKFKICASYRDSDVVANVTFDMSMPVASRLYVEEVSNVG